ncbi:hypothetical protein M434DRAFT_37202 [Hypoxylon sp. CO27-5]|nr:hypothetical protein M434DRAFT_37202 [Hypoxylon sp. CO27-5]
MADLLSMSASIAGLISIADLVFKAVYKYARAAKNAKDDINSLAEEINSLSNLLRSLQALALDLEAEGGVFEPTLRNHYFNQCRKTMESIEKRVKKANDRSNRSKAGSIIQQLKWPFTVTETRELLTELSRHKETINIALSAESMQNLQLCLSKIDGIGKQASSIRDIVRKIEINTQITVDKNKKRVLDYFMKNSPQGTLRKCINDRHPMTGLWLTESSAFNDWLVTPGSKIWLSGIPGAGKTVLAGSVIQEALTRSHETESVGVGFYFCDYRHPISWEPATILGAVASQLARQNHEAFDILRRYYEGLHPERGLPDETPDPDELRAQITSMSKLFDQTIMIVDGLDECGDTTDNVVKILMELADYSAGISMALFSRNHDDIRFYLQADFEHISIAAHEGDVRLYVGAELDKRLQLRQLRLGDMNMKDEIMSVLVKKSGGMFRWVACQLDYLCDCAHDEERREALTKLPPNLADSYRRLLERVNRLSPKVQNMVQLCLHSIAYAEPKLSIIELQQAVSTPESVGCHLDARKMITEEEISRRCSSLVRKSQDGQYFEFAHFSVKEFLEDEAALSATPSSPNLTNYLISKTRSCTAIAAQCLRFLQLENFKNQPIDAAQDMELFQNRDTIYPFYKYSAIAWLHLTRGGLDDPVTLKLAKSLFHPSKTAQFSAWAVEIIRYQGEFTMTPKAKQAHLSRTVSDDSFRPLHLASALNLYEICNFLLDGKTDVNFQSHVGRPIDLAITLDLVIAEDPFLMRNDCQYSLRILPCTERRNRTISCLIANGAKFSDRLGVSGVEPTFHSVVCELARFFHGDFTPIIALLSQGIAPRKTEIEDFELYLEKVFTHSEYNKVETSTLGLIQYLSSTSSFETKWGFQIGSIIWKWALKQDFAYTRNPLLVDSRISLSEEALIIRIETATRLDHADVVKDCLSDSRIDVSILRLERGGTLLHMAVEYASVNTVDILLDAGCNSNIRDVNGNTPLHLSILGKYDRNIIQKFVKKQHSLLELNAEGHTLWHMWATCVFSHLSILEDLYEFDPEATSRALLMKTPDGFTPLSLALGTGYGAQGERRALKIVKLSSKIPNFWQKHDPMFGMAVEKGYENVIRCLEEVNAKLDLVSLGSCTPLHRLRSYATPECVQLLQRLYGDVRQWRFEGRLPVELYISEAVQSYTMNTETVEALIPANIIQDGNGENETPWEFLRGLLLQQLSDASNHGGRMDRIQHVYDVLATYTKLGLHRTYEDLFSESVLIQIVIDGLIASIPTYILRQWINSTQFWPSARESDVVLRYLQVNIEELNRSAVELLIEEGVDIHQRINNTSAVEYACQLFVTASEDCDSVSGLERMILMLLDKSSKERLIDLLVDEGLHKLATHKNVGRFYWLITQFAKKGLDIASQGRAPSVLMHHIGLNSECAELLLNIGADPTSVSYIPSSLNVIQIATLKKNARFLKEVLVFSETGRLSVDWTQTFNISVEIQENLWDLQRINALHAASLVGGIDCLGFYLNGPGQLITDVNAESVGGYAPLHLAAYYNHVDIMKLLISKGANPMHEDNNKSTPLHWAVRRGNLSATRLLLKSGSSEMFDAFGAKPRAYVSGPDRDEIIRCLNEASEGDSMHERETLSPRNIHALSKALELAILENDLQECISIFALGCPIDVRMPSCLGCSPLILAMTAEEPKPMIVEWLVVNGASVLKSACQAYGLPSIIEIAVQKPRLNSILPKLFEVYIFQGGDLLSGDDYPLHEATWWQNIEGLESLLQQRYQMSPQLAMSTILNRRQWRTFGAHRTKATALHIASKLGNKIAMSLLIEKGALVDRADNNSCTPLAYTQSSDIAEHLISSGASIAAIYGRLPILYLLSYWIQDTSSRLLPIYFGDAWQLPTPKKSLLAEMSSPFSTCWVDSVITPERINLLAQLGHDLVSEHEDGRSWMHYILCQEDSSDLILYHDYGLYQTTPFPWHLEWGLLGNIAFLRSRFREFQQKLPREIFQRILNLEPKRGWSPLCRAACLDLVDVMGNCLFMGAQIDFEGCPAGSALMIAGICGSFDAVKYLVRHQAAVYYIGKEGAMSVLSLTDSQVIREWLLVKRFTELQAIRSTDQQCHSGRPPKECLWSGLAQARLRLTGKWEMQPHESSLDYAGRLAKLRDRWKGDVVPSREGLVFPM